MASFKVKNSNIFPMPGGNEHMIHMATIGMGLREFIVMVDRRTQKAYIEEAVLTSVNWKEDVTAHCKFIDDDNLAEDLAAFVEEQGLLDMKKIINTLMDRGRTSWIVGKS